MHSHGSFAAYAIILPDNKKHTDIVANKQSKIVSKGEVGKKQTKLGRNTYFRHEMYKFL